MHTTNLSVILFGMTPKIKIMQIEQSIRNKVLWPLGAVMLISLVIFILASHYYLELSLNRTQEKQLETLVSRYHLYMEERAGLMRSVMQQLSRDTVITNALEQGDRSLLQKHSAPLFEELLSEQHITHFYYHRPDGVNLLRVHKPERHGDKIERVTMHLAQRNNKISNGIELGPLGTFTLRVVMPVTHQNRLVGYLELGEDIDPIIEHLAQEGNDKIAILILKKFLDQKAWVEGRSMLGEDDSWGLLPNHVVGGHTDQEIIKKLPQLATTEAINNSEGNQILFKNKIHRSQFLNMLDAAGRSVGSMLILQDVDATLKNHTTSIWLIGLFCVLLVTTLFMIVATIISQVDRNLKRINEQLADRQSKS